MGMCKVFVGMKRGDLTVLAKTDNKTPSGSIIWKCQCTCGNIAYKSSKELLRKDRKVVSCGCKLYQNKTTHGCARRDKSLRPRLYRIWCGMRWRCNPKNHSGCSYVNKHIQICDEWNSFSRFYEWAMANGYQEDLTIDRIDYNGNYEPTNCRWADYTTQGNNKCNNHYISYQGETHTMKEWSTITGINYSTLRSRVNRQHLPFEKVISHGVSIRDAKTGKYIGGYDNEN